MGTNYYWHETPCSHCGQAPERLHICKSMHTFAGHFDRDAETWDPIPRIVSVADWRRFLREPTKPGVIRDEYGTEHDVDDFLARVDNVPIESRRRKYDWCREHAWQIGTGNIDQVDPSGEWLDAEGYSFTGREFS